MSLAWRFPSKNRPRQSFTILGGASGSSTNGQWARCELGNRFQAQARRSNTCRSRCERNASSRARAAAVWKCRTPLRTTLFEIGEPTRSPSRNANTSSGPTVHLSRLSGTAILYHRPEAPSGREKQTRRTDVFTQLRESWGLDFTRRRKCRDGGDGLGRSRPPF